VSQTWRLIIDAEPGDGAWNMALDRAIQLARQADEVPPTLRLYRWVRPTVTLGRFQDAAGVDRDLCRRQGIDVVRRLTGGRGVLHDDELTYSMVAGVGDGIPRGTAASYRLLCSALAEAYRLLGVDAGLTARPRGERDSAACYLHATPADLSLGMAKLSGSAQVWVGETVLQHGSFTRSRDAAREASVFGLSPQQARQLATRTATLSEVVAHVPCIREIVDAACEGLTTALDVTLAPGVATAEELASAHGLLGETSVDALPARTRSSGSR